MHKSRFKKHDKGNHPQDDQFIEGKIGSGYMSTIEGQPHLQTLWKIQKEEKNQEDKKQV